MTIRFLLLTACLLSGAERIPTARACGPQKPADKKTDELARWAHDLSSNSFSTRQEATRQLMAAGTAAVAAIDKHADLTDPEAVIRAVRVLKEVVGCENSQSSKAATKLLERIARTSKVSIATKARESLDHIHGASEAAVANLGGKVNSRTDSAGRRYTRVTLYRWRSPKIFDYLRCLPNLTLVLSGNAIKNEHAEMLKNLDNLQGLDLRYTPIGDEALKHVGKLTALQTLYLSGTNIGDSGLAHISQLSGLRTLYLSSTDISDAGLKHLTGLKKITTLSIRKTGVSAAGIRQLKQHLPKAEIAGP